MILVLLIESVINLGINIKVLDRELVIKYKKFKRLFLDEFCRNVYNFCIICCVWVLLEVGGL